jgi:hypothetical protein
MQESGAISHDYPCSSWLKSYQLSNWHKANYFVVRCKKALLQFILIKIATSILMCIVYPEYELHIHTQPTWDYIIYNRLNTAVYWITTVSSYFAYYYMAMFYSGMHRQLLPFKPDLKFVTFNSTMYYTYWQKVWMVFFQNRLMACFDHQAPVFYSKKLMYCIEVLLPHPEPSHLHRDVLHGPRHPPGLRPSRLRGPQQQQLGVSSVRGQGYPEDRLDRAEADGSDSQVQDLL